jgi:hypothetical protein
VQRLLLPLSATLVVVAVTAAAVCAAAALFLLVRQLPEVVPDRLDILYFDAVKWLAVAFAVGVPACILAVETTSREPVPRRWRRGRQLAVGASWVLGISCGTVVLAVAGIGVWLLLSAR